MQVQGSKRKAEDADGFVVPDEGSDDWRAALQSVTGYHPDRSYRPRIRDAPFHALSKVHKVK